MTFLEEGLLRMVVAVEMITTPAEEVAQTMAREAREESDCLQVTLAVLVRILESVVIPSGPLELIDEIVKYIHKESSHFGANVWIHMRKYPVALARNEREFASVLWEAEAIKYIKLKEVQDKYRCTLAREGYQRIDELRRTGHDSRQAFVAMSFKKDDPTLMGACRESIKPALENTGWQPIRMDLHEHNERIDDRMIAEIRRSGLLVADLTGHRQNVYFEAGFAMGLGIPVIYTCREDEATEDKVQFDTRQYKYIPWTDPTDLRQKLRDRIEATGLAKRLRENVSDF